MSRIWAYEKAVNLNENEEITSHDKADILLSQFEESERSPDTGKHPENGTGGGSDGGEVDDLNDNRGYYQYEVDSSNPNPNTPDETIDPKPPNPGNTFEELRNKPPNPSVDMNPNMNPSEIHD